MFAFAFGIEIAEFFTGFHSTSLSSPHAFFPQSLLTLFSVSAVLSASVSAAFVEGLPYTLTGGGTVDLAFDGTDWHIATLGSGYRNYNSSFALYGNTVVTGVSEARGLAYDANSNHLFIGDYFDGTVREITLGGSVLASFATSAFSLNALDYDARDNTLWLAHFNGTVEHRTRTGTLLSSFASGQSLSGLAIDTVNNTLLAMADNDFVYEYAFNGALLGTPVATDQLNGNGLGLAYDSSIGRLYASSQEGYVSVFDDPARAVPEPATAGLLLLGSAVFLRRRARS